MSSLVCFAFFECSVNGFHPLANRTESDTVAARRFRRSVIRYLQPISFSGIAD